MVSQVIQYQAKGLKHGLSGMMTFAFIFSPSQRWAKTLAEKSFYYAAPQCVI